MDAPEEMIRKVNDVHTKLAVFLANYLIEIEAKQMALQLTLVELGKLDQMAFAKKLAQQYVVTHTVAESQFVQRLKDDPSLAWLGVEFQSEAVN